MLNDRRGARPVSAVATVVGHDQLAGGSGRGWCGICGPGVPHAGTLTFLTLRYGLTASGMVLISLAMRAPCPRRLTEAEHFAVAGLLVHGVYLGGVFVGIGLGLKAGVSAVIFGLQPLLGDTATDSVPSTSTSSPCLSTLSSRRWLLVDQRC